MRTTSSIPLILFSRFIINLRQVEDRNMECTTVSVVKESTLNFVDAPTTRGVVGNMGQTLVFDGDEDDEADFAAGDMVDYVWTNDNWEVRSL